MPPGRKKVDGSGGQAAEALGRGCGGFGTKVHAAVNPLGHPVAMHLSGANAADSPHLTALIAGVDTDAVLADKGYDSDAYRDAIRAQGPNRASPRGGTGWSESSTTGTCTGSGTGWSGSSGE